MLQLSATIANKPLLSLRTGRPVAVAVGPILNPNNLKIEGFYCRDTFSKKELILLSQDIRELSPGGFIINDHEALSDPDDLIRLKEILKLRYSLVGKSVITESGQRIGKVVDYAFNDGLMFIIKLYVGQSIFRSLSDGQLSISTAHKSSKSVTRVSPFKTPCGQKKSAPPQTQPPSLAPYRTNAQKCTTKPAAFAPASFCSAHY